MLYNVLCNSYIVEWEITTNIYVTCNIVLAGTDHQHVRDFRIGQHEPSEFASRCFARQHWLRIDYDV